MILRATSQKPLRSHHKRLDLVHSSSGRICRSWERRALVRDACTESIQDEVFPWKGNGVRVIRNASPSELIEHALELEAGRTHLDARGALATRSGTKTGRSPKDKRLVREPKTEGCVWWGDASPNIPISEEEYSRQREVALRFLSSNRVLFVVDAFADWSSGGRVKVRIVCTRPYHALFMHNMLIRPSHKELASFGRPDFTIYNAGECMADEIGSMTSGTAVCLHLSRGEMVVLGTEYAGEMKKGVFTYMNFLAPAQGRVSLHSSCNVGLDGDATLFFGLSGTGKTTLSADPRRSLVGDDEHIWGDQGISNIEGGCYAKCIHLSEEKEPQIFHALRYSTVLENVVLDPVTREVDFDDGSITENTRAAYPIEFVANAMIPCRASHPKNIILLCCDAFGVLPPVAKLTKEQAMYHFVSGYTAKVSGTEMGIAEPQATFSPCFGSAFLVWHPTKYASLLAEKMEAHQATAWLVNTGWTGGPYGEGHRMPLEQTHSIIDAIHNGELLNTQYETLPIFHLDVPSSCTGVPTEILNPSRAWSDHSRYLERLNDLAERFIDHFDRSVGSRGGGSIHLDLETLQRIARAGPTLHSI